MATDGTAAVTISQQSIDGRLDAIDRSLLGLLPRSERLEFVSKVETRVRELLASGDQALEAELRVPISGAQATESVARSTEKKRSWLALTAGVMGLLSLLLMIAIPLVYIVASVGISVLPEEILIFLVGSVHFATLVAGSLAVVFGIAALIKLARRSGTMFGRGWAITGICTGPLPVMAGAVPLLFIAVQLLLSSAVSVNVGPSQTVSSPAPCATCTQVMPAMYPPNTARPDVYGPSISPAPLAPPSYEPAALPLTPYPSGVPDNVLPPVALPPSLPPATPTLPVAAPPPAIDEEKPQAVSDDKPAAIPEGPKEPPTVDEAAD